MTTPTPATNAQPLTPQQAEPITASQHHAWLTLLSHRLPGSQIRLCRAGEWTPNPVSNPVDAWFLLEAELDGRLLKIVSHNGYAVTADGPSYSQMYCVLEDGGRERYLSYADPAAAVEALRKAGRS